MIKVENIEVHGMGHATLAARNPMNSWMKGDSDGELDNVILGKKDLDLFRRLYKAGVEHRTYARMIYVWMEINAPLYWWKEMDRYTVGKSQVSTSTMHKIHTKEFTLDDFSHEHLCGASVDHLEMLIDWLNDCRKSYIEQKHKEDWWQLIQLLPSSYNQMRTVCMSYEVIFKIINERAGHKLDEWQTLVDILKSLPYIKEIMGDAE